MRRKELAKYCGELAARYRRKEKTAKRYDQRDKYAGKRYAYAHVQSLLKGERNARGIAVSNLAES